MSTDLVEGEIAQPLVQTPPHPLAVIELAVRQGASPETLEKLMALQERHEANEARKAFEVAFNAFKAEAPAIYKEAQVSYTTSKGTTAYRHASLDHICEQIKPVLAKHGLSHRWDAAENADASRVQVTCYLTHLLGHSETATLSGPYDQSGGKNPLQAMGSTITYLQRYTLLTVTGLAPRAVDNDGNADGKSPAQRADEKRTVSQEQAMKVQLEESIVDAWRKRVVGENLPIGETNELLNCDELKKLEPALKIRVWNAVFKIWAENCGWTWDKEAKAFRNQYGETGLEAPV